MASRATANAPHVTAAKSKSSWYTRRNPKGRITKYNPKIVLAFFAECKLPKPDLEYVFHPPRKWRFDFAWPLHRVALEVQGGLFTGGAHVRGAALVREHEKLNAAAAMGWRILYCQPADVATMATVNLIRATIWYD